MRVSSVKFILFFGIILISTFNFLTCVNQYLLAQGRVDFLQDSVALKSTGQQIHDEYFSLDIGIDSLSKLIVLKMEEFKALEQKLKQKSIELTEKEREFAKIEADLRMFHDKSSLMFLIGLGLFIGGCIFFLVTRKAISKKMSSAFKR